jgi:hypothetical protein
MLLLPLLLFLPLPLADLDISASMALPYTLQDGPTRYAPMPTPPGTAVTAEVAGARRQHPTSAFTTFTTRAGPPRAVTTVVPGARYGVVVRENMVAGLEGPGPGAGVEVEVGRWMRRWRD